MQRIKTDYVGVYYRLARRPGGRGKEKIYYVVFKLDGVTREEKVGGQYRQAMTPARAARIRADRIEGKRLSNKEVREKRAAEKAALEARWTISRLWSEYRANKPDTKSLRSDDYMFRKYLAPVFGEKEPQGLIPLEFDRLRLALLKTKSRQTVAYLLKLMRRIVNFGVKRQLCPPLGFTIELPKVSNVKTEDLSPEQLKRLLEAIEADPNTAAGGMMKLALFTGMRRGEMFKLQWQDIDFERGFILIRGPKGGQNQVIPMNSEARALLERHSVGRSSPYVFPGRGGRQRTDVRKQTRRIAEAAGLPKSFRALHGLRHVFASMLASSGQVDMYTLQKLLTHKNPQMTQRYAHLRDETLRRASDLAGRLVSENESRTA
ncbi:MAG: site-specific integrase [Candidatus Glassbacteria bacterium]